MSGSKPWNIFHLWINGKDNEFKRLIRESEKDIKNAVEAPDQDDIIHETFDSTSERSTSSSESDLEDLEDQIATEEMQERINEVEENEMVFADQVEEEDDMMIRILDELEELDLDSSDMIELVSWDVPANRRNSLFYSILQKEISDRIPSIVSTYEMYKESEQEYESKKQNVMLRILQRNRIIGATCTGAAMYNNLLRNAGAKIILIEEAGELKEPDLVGCLYPNLEHLILIGDEMQLQPKIKSYTLATKYHFAVSMFERLVNLGIDKSFLSTQLRMRPEISALTKPFYAKDHIDIIDAPCTLNRPLVPGLVKPLLFIQHEHSERKNDRNTKINEYEAQYSISIAAYLEKNSVQLSEITILTPYKGQMALLQQLSKSRFGSEKARRLTIKTIDDFQGEENRVILLSLVRSNSTKQLGFVKIQNRLIVGLSRARDAMVVLGNTKLLAESKNWQIVLDKLSLDDCITDQQFPITCQKHKKNMTSIMNAKDLDRAAPDGGCRERCDYQYECGHCCKRFCHPISHDILTCSSACEIVHQQCGHKCTKICHYPIACKPCDVMVPHHFTTCSHSTMKKCHESDKLIMCDKTCGRILSCGHPCASLCGDCSIFGCPTRAVCIVQVQTTCSKCSRTIDHKCSEAPKCNHLCGKILPCGHGCNKKCCDCNGDHTHQICNQKCNKTLFCTHPCLGNHTCHENCPTCTKYSLERYCSHGKGRKIPCTAEFNCREPCRKKCYCKDAKMCSKLCYEICDVEPCTKPCPRILKCNHPCSGVCGEPCPKICLICDSKKPDNDQFKDPVSTDLSSVLHKDHCSLHMLPCGHCFELQGLDNYFKTSMEQNEKKHIGYITCMVCKQPVFGDNIGIRYQKAIKLKMKEVQLLKRKVKENEMSIINRLLQSSESSQNHYNSSANRWYLCQCGEPYFIGNCGNGVEEGRCTKCKAKIGGQGVSTRMALSAQQMESFFH